MRRASALLALVATALLCAACPRTPTTSDGDPVVAPPPAAQSDAELEAKLRKSCALCHAFPEPAILPRGAWRTKVDRMYLLANVQLALTYKEPIVGFTPEAAARWFDAHAPERLDTPPWRDAPGAPAVAWSRRDLAAPPVGGRPPGVASVRLARLDGPAAPLSVVACDMLGGRVLVGDPAAGAALTEVARLTAPAHAEAVDLDADGAPDLVVADLGDQGPTDERVGSVVWLRRTGPRAFERVDLATGLGRVADVRAADFDGDGDLDLVAAVFGWYTSGQVLVLENTAARGAPPQFEPHTVDRRSGAITTPVLDLDGDGRLDFVVLLSQQHERVVAFVNAGDCDFVAHELDVAPHPLWGGSGLEPTDFDGDGDIDFLVTNGDTLDDTEKLKPWHGVAWLENQGGLRFTRHVVGRHYGAHHAVAVDVDGDGDLDVVSASFLPDFSEEARRAAATPGLVWFERTADGSFAPHTLDDVPLAHAALDAADLDGDGRAELVTGRLFVHPPFPADAERLVQVYTAAPR